MKVSQFSKHIFYSYDPSADIPEEVVIRRVINYGDVKDLILLASLFTKGKIDSAVQNNRSRTINCKRLNFLQKVVLD